MAAITNLLWKVKSSDKINLGFPVKGASKVDLASIRLVSLEANDFSTAFAGVWMFRD